MHTTISYLIGSTQILLLLHAAWTDVANRLISNYICLAIAIIGSFGLLLTGPFHLVISLLISTMMFSVLLCLHHRRIMGGGDVKLLLALSLGLSPSGMIMLFVVTALAGGLLAVMHLSLRYLPRPMRSPIASSMIRRIYAVERWRILKGAPLPYGVAIACGGIWAILHTINLGG